MRSNRGGDSRNGDPPDQPLPDFLFDPMFRTLLPSLFNPLVPLVPYVNAYQTYNFVPNLARTQQHRAVSDAESPPPPDHHTSARKNKPRAPASVMVQVVDLREDSDDPVDEVVPSTLFLPEPEIIPLDDDDEEEDNHGQTTTAVKAKPRAARPVASAKNGASQHAGFARSSASKVVAKAVAPPQRPPSQQPPIQPLPSQHKKQPARPIPVQSLPQQAQPQPQPQPQPPQKQKAKTKQAPAKSTHTQPVAQQNGKKPQKSQAQSGAQKRPRPDPLAPSLKKVREDVNSTQLTLLANVSALLSSSSSSNSGPSPTCASDTPSALERSNGSTDLDVIDQAVPTAARIPAELEPLSATSSGTASSKSQSAHNSQQATKRKANGKSQASSKKASHTRKSRAPSPAPTQQSASHESSGTGEETVFLSSKGRSAEFGLVADEFDVTARLPKDQRKCAFCGRGHQEGIMLQNYLGSVEEAELVGEASELDDPEGIWISQYPLMVSKNSRTSAHVVCALWAPLTVRKQGLWYNVAREVRRARLLKCKHCGNKGAALGCAVPSCPYGTHFSCALEQGWTPSTFAAGVNPYYCVGHAAQRRAERISEDRKCAKDIALGREAVPITAVDEESAAEVKRQFTYVARLVDSDEFTMPTNATKVHCCSCTDGCTDVTKCACLQRMSGKAYTARRLLFDPRPATVVECGLRCRCHISDCTNRVASQGIRYPLQVFKGSKGGWKIKTLKPIPQGAFVMEFIGQAVLGRSVLDALHRQDPAVCVIRRWEEASPPSTRDLEVEVCIDARQYGNAARFVAFSERNPNLERVNVFGGPHDPNFPRLGYYSSRHIEQGEVLTACPPHFL